MILEACVGNLNEALSAEKLGAHQIELCDRLDLDGTSPTIETVKSVCSQLNIPIKVIVNPNPFEYHYSSIHIQKIISYIEQLNTLPIQGIVFGPITKNGYPDLNALEVIASKTQLPITYHKAIDASHDLLKSVQLLIDQNVVTSILSSGGKKTALEGIDTLLNMQTILQETSISLIGAGRITAENLSQIHDALNLSYYHGKKIVGALSESKQ